MQKKIIVRQEEISDCGACSLLSIIRYYGGDASLENIRIFSLTNHTGVTALNLINCAKRYGFDAKGLRVSNFDNIDFPIIAHVNINNSLSHFLVIYNDLDTCYEIMDPAYGQRKIPKDEFRNAFSGNIIVLKPKVLIKENMDNKVVFKKILKVYKNKKMNIIVILFIILLVLFISVIYSLYLNVALLTNDALGMLYLFIVLLIIKELLNYYITSKKNTVIKSCSKELLQDFFLHIFRLPLKYVHLKDPGEIVRRIEEIESISEFYVNFILNMITNTIILSLILLFMFHTLSFSFILTFVSILIYVLYVVYSNRNIKELVDSNITSSTDYSMRITNYFSRLTSIKHSNNNDYFLNKLSEARDNYYSDDLKMKRYISRNNMIKKIIIGLFELLNNYILLINYYNGNIGLETIIIINTMFINSISSVESILNDIPSYFYYYKLINRLNDFYNINEDESGENRFIGGGIYCKNLTFSYNGVDNIIKNISFSLNRNDKVFMKGISGVGKSTICKILTKELIDYTGEIIIGGVDLKTVSLEEINNHIGFCSQNEALFPGTIKENILLGKDIPDDHFKEIIRICNLEQVIKNKPFAYDTYLYGCGEELSGGEKNLILLARCLVEEKQIYILDEALANVNEETEIKVIRNIISLYADKMIIYISHRDKSKYFTRVLNV